MPLSEEHLAELKDAKRRLEDVPFVISLSNAVGRPIEFAYDKLPQAARERIGTLIGKALEKAVGFAFTGMKNGAARARNQRYKGAVALSGAAGGLFGLSGVAVELPASTLTMMRSIGEIARENGEDITLIATRLECLAVFSMGGRSADDDAADSAYFATRAWQAQVINSAAKYAENAARTGGAKATEEAIPVLVKMIQRITTRFGVRLTQAQTAKIVPVLGAFTGAGINTLFLDYYQSVAKGHFTVRRLQRIYGAEIVEAAYMATKT